MVDSLKSHGIKRLCHLFDVSERVYHTRLRRSGNDRYLALKVAITALFQRSRHSAGKRTLRAMLKQEGFNVGVYLIAKLMKSLGLVSKQPQKKPRYAMQPHQVFNNRLNRAFAPEKEQTVLCGDVTYIKVKGAWCYLAGVLDLYRRRLMGWQFGRTQDASLISGALRHAMLTLKPNKQDVVLFHSDQGSIYGSEAFTACVKRYGLTQSMSRRGNCWDNAPMERWFRSFKYEWMPKGGYADFEEALRDIAAYVRYYNHSRPHSFNQGDPPLAVKTT